MLVAREQHRSESGSGGTPLAPHPHSTSPLPPSLLLLLLPLPTYTSPNLITEKDAERGGGRVGWRAVGVLLGYDGPSHNSSVTYVMDVDRFET